MLVFIASNDEHSYYIVNEYGNVAVGVWFSHYGDAEDYCVSQGYVLGEWEG